MSETNGQQNLVGQVVEVTACTPAEAEHFLAACANNVESAVALYFEQSAIGTETESVSAPAAAPPSIADAGDESEVRAPIAPIREQLIGPEDDNFFASTSPPSAGRLTRVTQRVKVCPLRDFQREGALMEEQLQAAGAFVPSISEQFFGPSHSRTCSRRDRSAGMVTAAHSTAVGIDNKASSSHLGDLFRPPTDILHTGTFQTSRAYATKRKLWLLVNVQSDNFDSQLLNRDVWSDKKLRRLIKDQFILWQVESDSSEGRRFIAFYHCARLPYVCVIDPRTGEEVWKSAEPKKSNILPDLEEFLREHKDLHSEHNADEPSTSKRSSSCVTINIDDDDDEILQSFADSGTKKRIKLTDLTEEEQIALAIKNSMLENGGASGSVRVSTVVSNINGDDEEADGPNSEFDSVEEFGADERPKSAYEHKNYEELLGKLKGELTALKLRLLNDKGTDEVVQLRWPSDTRLQALRTYIEQLYPHIPKDGYKLICAFPRKALEPEHNESSLKELGLHPSANLHLTLDD